MDMSQYGNSLPSRRDVLAGIATGALALGAAGLLSACGSSGSGKSGKESLDAIKKRGYALYGFDGENPYNYTDSSGKVIGSEIDIARYCFKQIGVNTVQAVAMDFNSFIPALQAKRIDTCLPIYIKPERCSIVKFATPDLKVSEAAVVKAGNPFNITNWDTVKQNTKIRIGLQTGATSTDVAKKYGIPNSRITLLGDFIEIEGALRANRIDVFIDDAIITSVIAKQLGSSFERVVSFTQPTSQGFPLAYYAAFPFVVQDVRDAFNDALVKGLNDGAIAKIRAPYGLKDDTLPGSNAPTMKQLCAKAS